VLSGDLSTTIQTNIGIITISIAGVIMLWASRISLHAAPIALRIEPKISSASGLAELTATGEVKKQKRTSCSRPRSRTLAPRPESAPAPPVVRRAPARGAEHLDPPASG
jgi:hypothetical protein